MAILLRNAEGGESRLVAVGADNLLEVVVEQWGIRHFDFAIVHAALLEAHGEHLADLVERRGAPSGHALVLCAQALEKRRDLMFGESGVEGLKLGRDEVRHELPHDAVVAHHGVEVCLLELIGCAMGDEVQDARAHGGPVRHSVDPPRAGARDGFDLTFGGILEWVVAQYVGSELGFGLEVLIEDEARDDAGLVDEPLLARDAASVGNGDAHRHPHAPCGRDTPR